MMWIRRSKSASQRVIITFLAILVAAREASSRSFTDNKNRGGGDSCSAIKGLLDTAMPAVATATGVTLKGDFSYSSAHGHLIDGQNVFWVIIDN